MAGTVPPSPQRRLDETADLLLGRLLDSESASQRVDSALAEQAGGGGVRLDVSLLADRVQRELTRNAQAVLQSARSLDEHTLLGVVTTLARQLATPRWALLVSNLTAVADPVSTLLTWRAQRRRKLTAEERAYLGLMSDSSASWGCFSLGEVRTCARHAFAIYGSFAAAFGRNDAGLGHFATGLAANVSHNDEVEVTATANAAGIPAHAIVAACWRPTSEFQPVAYVAVDEASRWIVLAIRGTMSGQDTLTDACCEPCPCLCGHAHAGFLAAAWQVVRQHVPVCARELATRPGYSLVIAGHSAGGAIAALTAALCRSGDADVEAAALRGAQTAYESLSGPGGTDVDAYLSAIRHARACAFACPAVASVRLSEAMTEFVTSVVAGRDVVPRLSVLSAKRFANRLAAAWRPVSRTTVQNDDEDGDPSVWSVARGGAELSDHASPQCLVPAGHCVHMRSLTSARGPRVEPRHCTAFTDIRLGVRMLSDHRPSVYVTALDALAAGTKDKT